jgi:hypothetical protein
MVVSNNKPIKYWGVINAKALLVMKALFASKVEAATCNGHFK